MVYDQENNWNSTIDNFTKNKRFAYGVNIDIYHTNLIVLDIDTIDTISHFDNLLQMDRAKGIDIIRSSQHLTGNKYHVYIGLDDFFDVSSILTSLAGDINFYNHSLSYGEMTIRTSVKMRNIDNHKYATPATNIHIVNSYRRIEENKWAVYNSDQVMRPIYSKTNYNFTPTKKDIKKGIKMRSI